VKGLVAFAGVILRAVNGARRSLYRAGVIKPKRLPRPVISIGNIAAGGAGKTPAVIAVAKYLTERGLRVAVLSRGYGRTTHEGGIVTSLDPDRFGDEPVLMKKRLNNVDVIVGSERYDNAIRYLQSSLCDAFLLDDGFQHLQLHRDLDVVIDIDSAMLFREGRSSLRDAGIVVPRNLLLRVPGQLRGKRVFAFSALADNAQFFATLKGAGLEIAGTREFRDHHRYSSAEIDAIIAAAKAAGAEAIVTTEKDAVKIASEAVTAIPAEFVMEPAVLQRIYEVAAARL
jgi:tetraacyldisaccharide 4'-kinase